MATESNGVTRVTARIELESGQIYDLDATAAELLAVRFSTPAGIRDLDGVHREFDGTSGFSLDLTLNRHPAGLWS